MRRKNQYLIAAPLALTVGFIAINPQRLHAFLGFGEIVFDPSSYAEIGEVWSQDISNGEKLAETYNQTVKIVKNGLDIYNLATQMSQRVQSKQTWKMAAFAVGDETTENHYNESVNFNAVMNGDYANAGTAWHQSTLNAGTGAYMGAAGAPNSSRMSQYATLQLLSQTSQRCAALLAQYNSVQKVNQKAEDTLAGDTYDESDLKNAEVAVLNVLSGGMIHVRTQARAQGNLAACQAEQNTLQAKALQDELAHQNLWYQDVANARAFSPSTLDPSTGAQSYGYLLP